MDKLNEENIGKFWKEAKRLAPNARNVLMNHRWTGNVRELQNTILRVCVMSKKTSISEKEARQSLFVFKDQKSKEILNRPLGDKFSLPDLLAEVTNHYLNRASEESGQNKSNAAKLIGLANYQTFGNLMGKYDSSKN